MTDRIYLTFGDRLSRWYNRAWCRIDGHQWMPVNGFLKICIRDWCRAEKDTRHA